MKIQVNGLSVAYDIAGSSGEWVTLSHAHCCNRETWQALRQQLSTHYRVLTFDARGHGDTSSTPPPYTMAELADDAFQLLQALGIHRTHWVGQAMGAMVGQTLALAQPQGIQSLVLADSTLGNPQRSKPVWDERNALAQREGLEALVASTLERWFTPETLVTQVALMQWVAEMISRTRVDGYIGGSQAMAGLDLNQRIQEIKCPTLVMVGAHDPATPVEMARRIHSQITHSSLVVLPDASHMANLEQPEQFNHHVLTFLASL